MFPTVIFEDNHLLLLYKPTGWLVQGDKTGDPTVGDWGKNYLKIKYEKPGDVFLHPVHRLDRPVSGLVLLARTSKALERLNKAFQHRNIEKTYFARVLGTPAQPNGNLRHFLLKNHQNNTVQAFSEMPHHAPAAREARLSYEVISTDGKHSLLKINPLTGRPHQIRVQLAQIGCPILGDIKYGAPAPLPDAGIALHAFRLAFEHPIRLEKMTFEAALPEKMYWEGIQI